MQPSIMLGLLLLAHQLGEAWLLPSSGVPALGFFLRRTFISVPAHCASGSSCQMQCLPNLLPVCWMPGWVERAVRMLAFHLQSNNTDTNDMSCSLAWRSAAHAHASVRGAQRGDWHPWPRALGCSHRILLLLGLNIGHSHLGTPLVPCRGTQSDSSSWLCSGISSGMLTTALQIWLQVAERSGMARSTASAMPRKKPPRLGAGLATAPEQVQDLRARVGGDWVAQGHASGAMHEQAGGTPVFKSYLFVCDGSS